MGLETPTPTSHAVAVLLDCPACDRPIMARFSYAVQINGELTDDPIPATAKVVGVQVNHDCTPKVTR